MKKTVLAMTMMLLMSNGYSQETKQLSQSDRDVIAQNLEKEASLDTHDTKTKKFLRKIAKGFKEAPKAIVTEFKTLDDCEGCSPDKTKEQIVGRNIGRKLGRASAWVTTATSKPFINAAGFLTGVFEKKDKNQDIVALYKFFLNHQDDFDKLYLEAGTQEEMVELMLAKMEEIVEKKSKIILRDYLVSLDLGRPIPEDLSKFELTDDEIACLDESKLNPDFINNHKEYQELKPIIGSVSKEEMKDIALSGYFDKSIGFDNYKAALPKVHEAAIALVGQVFGPKIALGVISSTLAGLYAVPVILADVGTGISTAICMQGETKDKFKEDKDLKSFCSYVINRSAYELMKSRAKGYVAGKNTRANIEKKISERKERRAKRREEKELLRLQKEMIDSLPVH